MEWAQDALAWLVELFRDENDKLRIELIGGVLVAAVLAIFWRLIALLGLGYRRVVEFSNARQKLQKLTESIARIRTDGRWSQPVLTAERELQKQQRGSIPILLVANLKGGVGKTTLAANLGAYFAAERKMRVLYVDLDFQGTLTATLDQLTMSARAARKNTSARVSDILKAPWSADRVDRLFEGRSRLQGVRIRTSQPGVAENLYSAAYYGASDELADVEDWLMLQWASLRAKDDVRFRLLRFLLSQRIQSEFDIVVLDGPPRDTTAGVNGLCAATYLVVPTKSDAYSTDGAFRYVERIAELQERLAPNAAMLGFVTTMTQAAQGQTRPLSVAEEHLLSRVQEEKVGIRGARSLRPITGRFPAGSHFDFLVGALYQRAAFQHDAGQSISYLTDNEIRRIVNTIGDDLWSRIEALEKRHASEPN